MLNWLQPAASCDNWLGALCSNNNNSKIYLRHHVTTWISCTRPVHLKHRHTPLENLSWVVYTPDATWHSPDTLPAHGSVLNTQTSTSVPWPNRVWRHGAAHSFWQKNRNSSHAFHIYSLAHSAPVHPPSPYCSLMEHFNQPLPPLAVPAAHLHTTQYSKSIPRPDSRLTGLD